MKWLKIILMFFLITGCTDDKKKYYLEDYGLLLRTVSLLENFKESSSNLGKCKRGSIAKVYEYDLIEKNMWYKVKCNNVIGWFKFKVDDMLLSKYEYLEDNRDKILEKYKFLVK